MLENTFKHYVQEQFLGNMRSQKSLFWFQNARDHYEKGSNLCSRDWSVRVDLSDSVQLFKLVDLPPESLRVGKESLHVLSAVDVLRQDNVHRRTKISVSILLRAISLPRLLRDDERATAVEGMWDYVSNKDNKDPRSVERHVLAAFEAKPIQPKHRK
ncbi:MAG: hypothetical protein Q9163_004495 [Psora crenata]